MEPGKLHALAPGCKPGGKGSLANLHFRSSQQLEEARDMLRASFQSLAGASGPVWLDMRKTWEERQPSRRLRRFKSLCWEHIDQQGLQETDISLDFRTRTLSIRGTMLGYVDRDMDACWSSTAEAWLQPQKQTMISRLVSATP